MSDAQDILDEIKPLGPKGYRKMPRNHRMTGPCSGVKTADLKKIRKRIRKDHRWTSPAVSWPAPSSRGWRPEARTGGPGAAAGENSQKPAINMEIMETSDNLSECASFPTVPFRYPHCSCCCGDRFSGYFW
jgi:hypothetical protein